MSEADGSDHAAPSALWRRAGPPLWPIVERHFEEAEFLAERWRESFDEPDFTLETLADGFERRLLAHLSALEIAGQPALERLHWPQLRDPEVERDAALVAGLGVLATASVEACDELLALLAASTSGDPRWLGMGDALALSDRPGLDRWLLDALGQRTRGPRAAAIAQALARRQVPLGPRLDPLLASDDPEVLIAAATLARAGDPRQLAAMSARSQHPDPRVVAAVVETALVRGVSQAMELARYWAFAADGDERLRARALAWLGLLGDARDERRLLDLLASAPTQRKRAALWALGFRGTAEAVDAALPWLGDDALGPLAGELLCAITGLPADAPGFWRDGFDGFDGFSDDALPDLADEALDEALTLEPEALLPRPDPEAIGAWWPEQRARLQGRRNIMGVPLDGESLAHALRHAPLRRRHALALLAQTRDPKHAITTRDWAYRQLQSSS